MAIKKFKPVTPGRRFMTVSAFDEITKTEPEPSLVAPLPTRAGRNAQGKITVRHRGGGHKRLYRIIDFKRDKDAVPVGTTVHNIELQIGRGGQLVRSAGGAAQVMAKEGDYAHIRLPSGEVRLIHLDCRATIGQVGNLEHEAISLGKAGRRRWLGWRPSVRGVVMDPSSHPHGGGEGKSPIGMPGPVSPWGKPTLGFKTRKAKPSDRFIVKRRK